MPIKHHKPGTYTPHILRNGSVIILGAKLPHKMSDARLISIARDSLEHGLRFSDDDVRVDLWGKKKRRRPDTAVFVLAHEIFFAIEHFDQVIWFNRTEDRDELWVDTDSLTVLGSILSTLPADARGSYFDNYSQESDCVLSVPRSGSFDKSLIELLSCFFATAAGNPTGPNHLLAAGYISHKHYALLCQQVELYHERLKREREVWAKQARENESEIIRVARELELDPEPAGTGPVQWYASCPGTGHRIMITSGANEFGCGYCGVKGGVDELRAFVARITAKSVAHHKKGTYDPRIVQKEEVVNYGTKPPASSKKELTEEHSEFDKMASQLYHRAMLKLLENTVEQKKDRQALQKSTNQENPKKPKR